jgi:uncharacterized protein YkwD
MQPGADVLTLFSTITFSCSRWYNIRLKSFSKANYKQEDIMRPVFILLLSMVISTGCFSQQRGGVQQVSHENVISPDFESDILFHVNEYRKRKGLAALEMNPVISEQAAKHSRDMATKRVPFSHDGFEERVRNIAGKLGTIRSSAENVAYGDQSAEEVVQGWIKSAGHRKNIEGAKYTITGIGVATDKNGIIYFTQIFAAK